METARIFQSGESQAARSLLDQPWATLTAALAAFEPGFVLERNEPENQFRPDISA